MSRSQSQADGVNGEANHSGTDYGLDMQSSDRDKESSRIDGMSNSEYLNGFSNWTRTAPVGSQGTLEGYVDEWSSVTSFKTRDHRFLDKPRRTKEVKERERIIRESEWQKEYWSKFPSDEQVESEAKEYFSKARCKGLIYVAQKGDGPLMFGVRAPDPPVDKTKMGEPKPRPVHRSVRIGDLEVVKVDRRVFKKLVQSGEVVTGGPGQGSQIPIITHDWRGKEW